MQHFCSKRRMDNECPAQGALARREGGRFVSSPNICPKCVDAGGAVRAGLPLVGGDPTVSRAASARSRVVTTYRSLIDRKECQQAIGCVNARSTLRW